MDKNKTTIFWDFDGVFNFDLSKRQYLLRGNDAVFGHVYRAQVPTTGDLWFNLLWSGELVRKLQELKNFSGFTWLWLTTWVGNTDVLDRQIGTPADGVVFWVPVRNTEVNDRVKLECVLAWVAEHPDENFVWVDDEASKLWTVEVERGVRSRGFRGRSLVLVTDAETGFTRSDFTTLEDFLSASEGS